MRNRIVFTILIAINYFFYCGQTDAYIQRLILYEQENFTGTNIQFETPYNDLSRLELGPFLSYCYRGFWNVYQDADYMRYSITLIGNSTDNFICLDQKFGFLSFRFGGHTDTDNSALTLYALINFEGEETLVTGQADAKAESRSLVFSGSSNWTLYENHDYSGKSCCIYMTDYHPDIGLDGYININANLGIPIVKAVLKGCRPGLDGRAPSSCVL